MCAIRGIATDGSAPDCSFVIAMMARLSHRSPDSSGCRRDDRAVLCHTRLSLIPPEGGAQPIGNEDGSVWVTFAGEIHNYVELAAQLHDRGRDRLGIRPLYFHLGPGRIAPRTPFIGIQQVPPGHLATFVADGLTSEPYGRIEFPRRGGELSPNVDQGLFVKLGDGAAEQVERVFADIDQRRFTQYLHLVPGLITEIPEIAHSQTPSMESQS